MAGWPGGRMAGWPGGRVAGWPTKDYVYSLSESLTIHQASDIAQVQLTPYYKHIVYR